MTWLKNSIQLVGWVHQEIAAMPAEARRKGWARVAGVLVIAACIAALTGCGKTEKPEAPKAVAGEFSAEIAELSKDRARFKEEVVKCSKATEAKMNKGDYSGDARCSALVEAFYRSSEHKGYKGGWPPGGQSGGQK
jgi:outer membrane murein-binding lipoprotein Lpp